MFAIGLCVGFSLGVVISVVYMTIRDADPTRWTPEDERRLQKEKYLECLDQQKQKYGEEENE